jgi:hypothetical protein
MGERGDVVLELVHLLADVCDVGRAKGWLGER